MNGVVVMHIIEKASGKVREEHRGDYPRASSQVLWQWKHSMAEADVGVLTVTGYPGEFFESTRAKILDTFKSNQTLRDKEEESGWL